MPPIEFLNLSHYYKENKAIYLETFEKLMDKSHFILGEYVQQFEKEFAQFCKSRYAFGVGNGLDALVIALKALDIQAGDEVIVPSHTFIATWLAVSATGATPIPVEVDPGTFNIDPEKIAARITKKTRAIIGVHLYGRPFDAKALQRICKTHGLYLIEDAAQAHGANVDGQTVGSIGDVACFSFYPGKNLGAYGDGGAVTTQSDELAKKISMIRNYGSQIKYHHDVIGMNSRLDELLAAFLLIRLKTLENENKWRNDLAGLYHKHLAGVSNLSLPAFVQNGLHVWHLFVVRTENRDALLQFLKARDIQTMIHYPIPCHLSKCYSHMGFTRNQLPISEAISETCLSLPIGPHLQSDQIVTIAETIKLFFKS